MRKLKKESYDKAMRVFAKIEKLGIICPKQDMLYVSYNGVIIENCPTFSTPDQLYTWVVENEDLLKGLKT